MDIKRKNELSIRSSAAEYLTYVAAVGDSESSIEIRYEDENIWLTQRMMAALYNVAVSTINEHLKTIFHDSELEENATIRKFRIVQKEGDRDVSRDTNHYNLQAIIAVGFKVVEFDHFRSKTCYNRCKMFLTTSGSCILEIAKHFFPASLTEAPI